MTRFTLTVAVLVASWLPCAAQDDAPKATGPSAVELRSAGAAQAKKEGKQVFLIFGSPSCGWCKYFDKYHADPDVARVIEKHLVLVKVDTVENAGGEEMFCEFGKARGVPAFSILDPAGKVLADSGDAGKNIGFPYKPHEVDHYLAALKAACPTLSQKEVDFLAAKLKEIGPKMCDEAAAVPESALDHQLETSPTWAGPSIAMFVAGRFPRRRLGGDHQATGRSDQNEPGRRTGGPENAPDAE